MAFTQAHQTIAERREPFRRERQVDSVVHPVAGDDGVGPRLSQDTRETLQQIGARELSAGVAFLGKTGDRLAWEAQIQKFNLSPWKPRREVRLDGFHVLP